MVRLGVLLSQTLNSLKHTPHSFAQLYNIPYSEIATSIQNDASLSSGLINALIENPAIDQSHFRSFIPEDKYVVPDEQIPEYYYTSALSSSKSSRIFKRNDLDYYDYKDLAAAAFSPILPEHITPLVEAHTQDDFVSMPSEFFNNGHLEHQITYFVGDINFHWKTSDGRLNTKKMSHLDRNYITPYVPHTFTTRSSSSYIVAVTFRSMYSSFDKKSYFQEVDRLNNLNTKPLGDCKPVEFYSHDSEENPHCFSNHPRFPYTKYHTFDFAPLYKNCFAP